jgi:hypothetical protein
MSELSGIEQTFAHLAKAPVHVQEVLRPILFRATQDAAVMRGVEPQAFANHFFLLGALILDLPREGVGAQLPSLQTFEHLTTGENVEDAEEAYDFVRTLGSPLRERVEGGLSRTLRRLADHPKHEPVNLLAMARLLAIALSDLPHIVHVLSGREVEPFLPDASQDGKVPSPRKTPRKSHTKPAEEISPHLQDFVGALVEITTVVSGIESGRTLGRLFLTIGRVEEITPAYAILRSLPAHHGEQEGDAVLVGLAHVISMRKLSASLRRAAS